MAAAALATASLAWGVLARAFAPTGNTSADHFDVIVVLGASVDRDGNPNPVLQARLTEAVHEYERGVAPHMILTGGEIRGFDQAAIMARVAGAQGVPESALVREPNAQNTIENACFSERIMKARGWTSAEIVTSPSHAPRAGMIFSRVPIAWRMHAAPPLEPPTAVSADLAGAREVMHTVYYLLYSKWADRCSP